MVEKKSRPQAKWRPRGPPGALPRHFPEFRRGQTEDLNDPSSRIWWFLEKKRAPGVPGPQCRPDPDLAPASLWLPHSLGVRVRVRVRVRAVRGNSGATGVLSEGPGPTPKNATPPLRGDKCKLCFAHTRSAAYMAP